MKKNFSKPIGGFRTPAIARQPKTSPRQEPNVPSQRLGNRPGSGTSPIRSVPRSRTASTEVDVDGYSRPDPPPGSVYTDAEMARIQEARDVLPDGLGFVKTIDPPKKSKPIEPELSREDLQRTLRINPKLRDNFEVWVVAKHLRILGLAEELSIDPDEPDTKQFRCEVGVLKQALN